MAVPASSIAFFTSNPLTMHTLGEPDCKICLAPFSHTAQQIPVYHTCTNGRLSIQKVDAFHVGCLKQAIQAKETATRREAELFGRPIDPTIGSECPICQLVFDKKQLPSEDQFTKDQIEANQKAVYKLIRETIQGNRTSTSQSLSDLLGFDITQLPSQDQFLH